MRRVAVLLALWQAASLALAQPARSLTAPDGSPVQVWERLIAPGLTLRSEVDYAAPRTVYALRWSPQVPGLLARTEVGGGRVFGMEDGRSREEVSGLVRRGNGVAGINGDFFPTTGDPLGVMIRDGELISRPDPRRAGFGWGPSGSRVVRADWSGALLLDNNEIIPLNGINEACPENGVVVNTSGASLATAVVPCVFAVVRVAPGVRWTPNGLWTGTVDLLVADQPSQIVAPGTVVFAARGARTGALTRLKRGQTVRFRMATTGLDGLELPNVIGGGPQLVRAGMPFVDWEAAGFNAAFAQNRHPRTAIGQTAEGDLWWVVVDGRQAMSRGATLVEMAEIMRRLGCVEAVNLDGGGSSALHLLGIVVNRPSDGVERKVANGIVLQGNVPFAPGESEIAIMGPRSLRMGQTITYGVVGVDGARVADPQVLWSAMGAAWVDPGGTVRPLQPGAAKLRASVNGRVLEVDLVVEGVIPPPPAAAPPKTTPK